MSRCESARWGRYSNARYELEFPGCFRSGSHKVPGFNFPINTQHALKGVQKQDADKSTHIESQRVNEEKGMRT